MNYTKEQENAVNKAFSKQSPIFDEITNSNSLERLYRSIIRTHVLKYVTPNQTMLELNAGTGIDAVFFVNQGLSVHATDNADGMLNQLQQKIIKYNLNERLTFQKCSFNELEKLDKRTYHHVFSNFGGLNCTDDLQKVIRSLDEYMIKDSIAHLVVMPRYCLWEILFIFKANFKLAFRRLKRHGTPSKVEELSFLSYYYSPRYIKKSFGKHYKTLSLKAMGCFIPPTYMDKMEANKPFFFKILVWLDSKLAHKWPFYNLGDHYIISIQKLV